MVKTCSECNVENPDESGFCGNCGEALTAGVPADVEPARTADDPPDVEQARTCRVCESEIPNPAALFCPRCGASVSAAKGLSLPSKQVALIGGGIAAVVVVVLIGVLLFSGGGGDDEATRLFADLESEPLSEAAVAAFALAADELPDPVGDTEAEMLHSLLGQPDIFVLQFEEPEDGGATQRFETWLYLDLGMSYDFLDGVLLFAFPIDEPAPLTLIPLRFDPLDFTAETTLDDLRAMMFDPDSLEAEQPSEEYGTPFPIWVGEQLLAQFDNDGALFYLETVPLGPEE